MRNTLTPIFVSAACVLLWAQTCSFAAGGAVPASNIKGKKLIGVSQALNTVDVADLPGMVVIWQDSGYDGVSLSISADPASTPGERQPMRYRWWLAEALGYDEFERDIQALKAVDWGRLTDNFLWMASFADRRNPSWFDDEGWQVLLHNARLGARIVQEIGFKGIILDREGYAGDQLWNAAVQRRDETPEALRELEAKVRQRGRQWTQALCEEYPAIVLGVMSTYACEWRDAADPANAERVVKHGVGLWPAFVDGILPGLGDSALLVDFDQQSYVDSQYGNLLRCRNQVMEQALVISTVPDLARKRLSYAAGLWTDAGFGPRDRFSNTDARVNQRDPERHKHATHNALAVSDHYVWHWTENGPDGSYSFLTTTPTPLMRQYWQANVDAHEPMSLQWEPEPHHDTADYTQADADAAKADAAFWAGIGDDGYTVAVELPEYWKFRLDTEMLCRWYPFWTPHYDDGGWNLISTTRCWQSQGIKANEIGLYRIKFEAPPDLDIEKQKVVLAFGGFGKGAGHVYLNARWIARAAQIVDVSEKIKPGQSNQVGASFMNKQGPGGLMGHVKLLVRDR